MKNSDAVLVTGRLSKEEAAATDCFAESHGTSRSQVVADAVRQYVHLKECILCGAQNPADGKICSCCGALLFDDDEIISALSNVCDELEYPASSITEHNEFIAAGYKLNLIGEITRSATDTNYLVKFAYITKEGLLVLPADNPILTSVRPEIVYLNCKKNRQTKVKLPELDPEFVEPMQPAWVLPNRE